jgi:tetratricopeptide (TPR) repeat protein
MDREQGLFRRVTAVEPRLAEIEAALGAGDAPRAAMLAQAAMNTGLVAPYHVRLTAEALARQGHSMDAVRLLKHGLALTPNNALLLVGLGAQDLAAGRTEEAVAQFEAAIEADPTAAEPHYALGKAHAFDADMAAAREALEQAVALAPNYAEAHATLANLFARGGDAAAARVHAEQALALAPHDAEANMALAVADVHEGAFAAAEARLRGVLRSPGRDSATRVLTTGLLADALDGQGRTAAAYMTYAAGNEMNARTHSAYATPSQDYVSNLDRLRDEFEKIEPNAWRGAPAGARSDDGGVRQHVFLVGFPRSGTTLLEQVLAAHPMVTTLEEKPALAKGEAQYFEHADDLEKLTVLDAAAATDLRQDYWRVVGESGVDPAGTVFIDKLPLNTPNLPLIAKLFPNARILFARRDPRDVVFSCFRRSFLINRATYAMLTLKGAARLYDAVMRLKVAYDGKLPLPVHEVRYERLVEDFEVEARATCDFIGLDWDDGMHDFAAKAAKRAVNTPSAAQVRKGLYREGAGQWRRYRDQLAPIMPILAPWIGPFGYPAE